MLVGSVAAAGALWQGRALQFLRRSMKPKPLRAATAIDPYAEEALSNMIAMVWKCSNWAGAKVFAALLE